MLLTLVLEGKQDMRQADKTRGRVCPENEQGRIRPLQLLHAIDVDIRYPIGTPYTCPVLVVEHGKGNEEEEIKTEDNHLGSSILSIYPFLLTKLPILPCCALPCLAYPDAACSSLLHPHIHPCSMSVFHIYVPCLYTDSRCKCHVPGSVSISVGSLSIYLFAL